MHAYSLNTEMHNVLNEKNKLMFQLSWQTLGV